MKISFNIEYITHHQESVSVVIAGVEPTTIALSSDDGRFWRRSVDYPLSKPVEKIEYHFVIYRGEELVRREIISTPHTIELDESMCSECIVDDAWRELPAENYRYSAAFNHFIPSLTQQTLPKGRYVTFRVLSAGLTRKSMRLALCGEGSALGDWGKNGTVAMREISPNLWSVSLPVDRVQNSEYKLVAVDSSTNEIIHWERGENRRVVIGCLGDSYNYLCRECEVEFDCEPIRIAGGAIPIFSLRSQGGCGVGDFGDLKQYIIWTAATGQQAVQILPINDTTMNYTWKDSYPYNSISIYAFHPIYIDLRELPRLNSEDAMAQFESQRKELNALKDIDYERVNNLKRSYIREVFHQQGGSLLDSDEFKEFFQKNRDWLQPYAAFSVIRDQEGTANFNEWSRYSRYNSQEINEFCSPMSENYASVSLYYYMQYLLHIQLLSAANVARDLGVILKGDIPIGISRESVEAWVEPHYFNMNGQAGAPPDAFSVNGQNWGFPTYNWEVMQRDNYLWWRGRFAKMSEYFTAYRIDHILGFFRIWEIPQHSVHGLLGQFAPAIAMSPSEIEGWGLHFQQEFMTQPFINDELLDRLFGDDAQMVREKFVKHLHHDIYAMREEFSTQRLVENHFHGADDEASLRIKEALYSLISNVLFVVDHHNPQGYHPRISVQGDYIFSRLSQEEQTAFNQLYNHYYYQRHNQFWYDEAMKKLPVLTTSTSMLVCGEDLGMVPLCVEPVMKQLQIISLEIERMPKSPDDKFGNPAKYPHSSVCTIGTHDMSTLRGWWREDREISQDYFREELKQSDKYPADASAELCREVITRHLDSPSMLAIITWQDWLAIDESLRNPDIEGERINIPANPRHYWRWRMHLSIEELAAQKELNDNIRELITNSSRSVD
ncbi:MAG: 4-alpha-glucanotransferase [Rikenellaceae bacterium]